ncbi:MAG: hypothetical protein ACOYL6_02885 [Bacteriovoracaceae bacterium]
MNAKQSKLVILSSLVFFALLVTFLNYINPANGDELFHTNTAFSILKWDSWKYRELVQFNGGYVTDIIYTRAKFITLTSTFLMSIFGPIIYPLRFLSLLISFITLGYVGYIAQKESGDLSRMAKVIFLTSLSSFFILSAFNLRFYAPLSLLTLIGTYQFYLFLRKRSWKNFLFAVPCFAIPMLDSWHNVHLTFFAVFVAIYFFLEFNLTEKITKLKHWKIGVGLLLLGVLVVTPFVPIFLDKLFIKVGLMMGSRQYMGYHHDYFDNIVGLIRFALVTLPLCVTIPKWKTLGPGEKFFAVSAYAGLVHGLVLGLWTPHNHIFYYRYFAISSLFATLGYSVFVKNKFRFGLFVIANILVLSSEHYSRPRSQEMTEWLKNNYDASNSILVSDFDYNWNTKLRFDNAIPLKGGDIVDLKTRILENMKTRQVQKIYYFSEDPAFIRIDLHKFFFPEEDRIAINHLSRYLMHNYQDKDVFKIKSAHLYAFSADEFITALDKTKLTDELKRHSSVMEIIRFFKKKVEDIRGH